MLKIEMENFEIIFSIDHIGGAIFSLLSNEDLCSLRLVCRKCKNFIDNAKFYNCRILKKFHTNHNNIISRILKRNKSVEIERLAEIILQSRRLDPYIFSIEHDKLDYVEFLWNFIEVKNPPFQRDLSAFHYSAAKGRKKVVGHFLNHLLDKNPSNFGNTRSLNVEKFPLRS